MFDQAGRDEEEPKVIEELHSRASSLADKFKNEGESHYISEAIVLDRNALVLCPPGHPKRAFSLSQLSDHLWDHYGQLGAMVDIDECIVLSREALSLRPPGHADRSVSLNDVALYLFTRYERLGGTEDLDEAIILSREALSLRPSGHPDHSLPLNNTAYFVFTRYQLLGGMEDLDEAIVLNRDALMLCPRGHPDHWAYLNNIPLYLSTRYQRLGGMEDLDEAIMLGRDGLALCPPGHQGRSTFLSNVALYLFTRYQRLGGMGDLDEAIMLVRDGLALCPLGSPDRWTYLNNLALYLSTRYQRLGGTEDLDEAIMLGRDAVALCPPGHQGCSMARNNVALHLFTRYQRLRGTEDLVEAIMLGRDTLALCPPGSPDRWRYLNNVAQYLFTRYQRLRGTEDLNEAIMLGRDALALCPPGHQGRSTSLNNIALYLTARYCQFGGTENLDEAITLGRDALALCPPGHPGRSMSLNNVAGYVCTRHKWLGGMEDLDEAIVLGRDALALNPPGSPGWSLSLENLTKYLHTRFKRSSQSKDKEELFSLYTQMANMTQSPSSADLYASRAWVDVAEEFHHPSTLLAYQTSLQLLVHHLAALPSLPRHLDLLKDLTSSLAVDAFSGCIRYRSHTKAIELLEQGRSVFWTQLSRLNAPLDDIAASGTAGMALAEKFTQLTSLIRNVLDSPSSDQHERLCHLNIEVQRVVTAIRELPGLSRFLQPSLFQDLQQAASGGPVVILNASKYSCDALIVLLDRDPVHIPIRVTKADVARLSSELHTWTGRAKLMDVTTHLAAILRELWDKVVSPIIDFLQTVHPSQSRIWWCPTAEFSLLPLHTAGPYRKGQRGLADFYVSSYTSTLTALIRARRVEPSYSSSVEQCFVGIGQAKASGESELHSVGAELVNVGQCVNALTAFTRIEGPDSCISRVEEELKKNQWVHLACHGLPNRKEPFKSAFALSDGRFTIEHIMRCRLPNAEFAYLSACHTTVGYEKSPDEMIHLASAIQFAGFRSVIGTMWAVDDDQARKVTSMFYENMVDESGRLDHTRAAFALHKTMREVRGISFDQRILYVHIGA